MAINNIPARNPVMFDAPGGLSSAVTELSLDMLPVPALILDGSLNAMEINKTLEQILGLDRKNLLSKRPDFIGGDLNGEQLLSGTARASFGGRIFGMNASPLPFSGGKDAGYLVVLADETEKDGLTGQLQAINDRLAIILSQTGVNVWNYDIANEKFSAHGCTGLSGEYPSMSDDFFSPSAIDPAYLSVFNEFISDIRSGKPEVRCIIKTSQKDSETWLRLTGVTELTGQERPTHAYGLIKDVTNEVVHANVVRCEQFYRRSIDGYALFAFECDLTSDRIIQIISGSSIPRTGEFEFLSYTKIFENGILAYVRPEYRSELREDFSPLALSDAYSAGQHEVQREFRIFDSLSNSEKWVRMRVIMLESQETGALTAFFRATDIDAEKNHELKILRQATYDPLTGILNRAATLSRVQSELEIAHNMLCAFMIIDIDNFKSINDTFGHMFGDGVLAELTDKIRWLFRKTDVFGRLAGDEFIIFLSDIPTKDFALKKAAQICSSLKATYSSGGMQCGISGSVGIAFYPHDGKNFNDLYRCADAALYAAKFDGKNRYSVYSGELESISRDPGVIFFSDNDMAAHATAAPSVSAIVSRTLLECSDASAIDNLDYALRACSESVFIFDGDGIIKYINRHASSVSRDVQLGKACPERIRSLLTGGTRSPGEMTGLMRGGVLWPDGAQYTIIVIGGMKGVTL